MTTPVEVNPLLMNSNATTYTVGNSLRFRSSASAYMNRTTGAAGNAQTFTLSTWVKRGSLGADMAFIGYAVSGLNYVSITFNSSDQLLITTQMAGVVQFNLLTTQVFRDPSSWYHIVVAFDTTQATASNRIKVYVNGQQVTAFSLSSYPSQNLNTYFNNATTLYAIGNLTGFSQYFDGYFAEYYWIDGQQLTPSNFGAYDATTGVWQPKKYTGTYGTNGFYLPFSNNSSVSNLGLDFSGNGNNWTPNNFSLTTGVTYDSMIDSPTPTASGTRVVGNYAVWNPLNSSANNFFWANLESQANAGANNSYANVIASMGQSSGKYYFELYYQSGSTPAQNQGLVGVTRNALVVGSNNWGQADDSGSIGFQVFNNALGGRIMTNGAVSSTAWQGAVAPGDYVMIAVDCDNQTIFFGVNGTWRNSSNPATNTSGISLPAGGGTWSPFWSAYRTVAVGSLICDVNFGQRPFQYTPPTGFRALCTSNLPTPSIVNGATAMAATLYTGTGAVANINNGTNTTLGTTFQPDLVWIKSRSNATNNNLFDSVRGATNYMVSNLTNAQATNANTLTSFASNGFALGTDAGSVGTNISGNTYVGWQWIANGTAVSNTAGTITSNVSANPTTGFSVVSFTVPGAGSSFTVGHGLGAAPDLIIMSSSSGGSNWSVYANNSTMGPTRRLLLNTNNNFFTSSIWNNTAPTSTVFSTDNTLAGSTVIAYCWASVSGYSSIGTYVGNGSTDGPFIYTGFRPRYVLFKGMDVVNNWFMFDTSRNTYNLTNLSLTTDQNAAESTFTTANSPIDILSNGFKLRGTGTGGNSSGGNYLYMAFAENPFKYSLAR